ncbi:hypothetical protein M0E87_06630 [Corynebacterium sp. CCM 9185]|uniref:Uncharacterized protein n=1 Tax=Corynebacterium marambiense TaxID=2765364 RepID=A0ABS0VT78_9CORY|nr:hypothetical protein [Corynebacterium marambiense]MBI8999981.1 hypothetical protein [Corynebacterium marambiense]MCK7663334.1 hypothetical protein [Corynebacterium marambiense]
MRAAHANDPQAGYRYLRDEVEAAGVVMCGRTALAVMFGSSAVVFLWQEAGETTRSVPAWRSMVISLLIVTITAGLATDFIGAACGVNLVWVTDITEHLTGEGKLYCCGVKDRFSYRVVGYSAAPHMSSGLVVIAFNTVVVRREINRRSVTGWVVPFLMVGRS